MDKTKITLNIGGKNYTILTSDDPRQIQRAANYVGRKMDQVYLTSRTNAENAAIITAIGLAEELMQCQDENSFLRRQIAAQNDSKQ